MYRCMDGWMAVLMYARTYIPTPPRMRSTRQNVISDRGLRARAAASPARQEAVMMTGGTGDSKIRDSIPQASRAPQRAEKN